MNSYSKNFKLFNSMIVNILKNYFIDEYIEIRYIDMSSHVIDVMNSDIVYYSSSSLSAWCNLDFEYNMKNVNTAGFVVQDFYTRNNHRLQLNITYYVLKKQFSVVFGQEKLNFNYDDNLYPINITNVKKDLINFFITEMYSHIDSKCKIIHFLFRV